MEKCESCHERDGEPCVIDDNWETYLCEACAEALAEHVDIVWL